ncbi:MAG: cation:proton antiporter subunit C [Oscillospiraceae bacterium]|nr:cation:proton antiporter subunit C [Oscillospiraceae bacterium]
MQFLNALVQHRYAITATILFVVGLMNLMQQRYLVRKVIGFNIMDAAIFLLLASRGYVAGRSAPVVAEGMADRAAELYINPVPAGLVLTGIVVSVSVSAFSLALIQKIYREYGSTDIKELVHLVKRED